MSTRTSPPTATRPIVDYNGQMTQEMRSWTQIITGFSIVIGSGNPENVIEAEQGALYMADDGTAGSILYVKRDANVSGDKTQGWILV